MATLRRRLLASIALLGAILFYPAWTFWDMHRLKRMCGEIRPGMPVANIRRIVTKYGLERFLLSDDGLYDDRTKNWDFFIPAPSTMGDMVCLIEHDRVKVISTKVLGP
jgi:hypothetical protein